MTTDVIQSELGNQGFVGSIQDRQLAFFQRYGDSQAKSLQDAEMSFLLLQGVPYAQLDDMWNEFLKDLPYGGDLQEKKRQFWSVAHGFYKDNDNDSILLESGYKLLLEDGSILLVDYNNLIQEDDVSFMLIENSRFTLDNGFSLILEDGDDLFLENEDNLILN